MNSNLICILSWGILFIIFLSSFTIFFIITIIKNYWIKAKNIANNLSLEKNIYENIFGNKNPIRQYLTIKKCSYAVLIGIVLSSIFIELSVAYNIFLYMNVSQYIIIICAIGSAIKMVVSFCLICLFLPFALNKQINKDISNKEFTYYDKFKYSKIYSKIDNVGVQNLLTTFYFASFKYIMFYKNWFTLNKSIYSKELEQIDDSYNEMFQKKYRVCFSIAYTVIIQKHELIDELLKLKPLNYYDHKELNKDQLIELISNNIFILSNEYLDRIDRSNFIWKSREQYINECFSKWEPSNS